MSDFRPLADGVFAAGQIAPEDVERAKHEGFTLIVNNRPEDEEQGQPSGAAIEAAAREAGLDYRAIPVGGAGFGMPQIEAMETALESADGNVLAFCRSGTRSTLLWALARAKQGGDPEEIAQAAAGAGYDVALVRPAMDMLASDSHDG